MKHVFIKSKTFLAGLVLFQLLGGGLSHAATITLNYVDSGHYDNLGNHTSTNQNYVAGEDSPTRFHNWFVFDLSSVTDPIVSATLRLFNPEDPPTNGYMSPDTTETYNLYNVTTPIGSLTTGGFGLTSTYTDLGSGTQYGSIVMSRADNGTIVNISLNGNALTALNGATGLFALGGAVTTLGFAFDTELVFAGTAIKNTNPVRELVLETEASNPIPEPSTMLLLGSGLVGLIGYRMKKAHA